MLPDRRGWACLGSANFIGERARAVTHANAHASNSRVSAAVRSARAVCAACARAYGMAGLAAFVAGTISFGRGEAVAVDGALARARSKRTGSGRAANARARLAADDVIRQGCVVGELERCSYERGYIGQLPASFDNGSTCCSGIGLEIQFIERHGIPPLAGQLHVADHSSANLYRAHALT